MKKSPFYIPILFAFSEESQHSSTGDNLVNIFEIPFIFFYWYACITLDYNTEFPVLF